MSLSFHVNGEAMYVVSWKTPPQLVPTKGPGQYAIGVALIRAVTIQQPPLDVLY